MIWFLALFPSLVASQADWYYNNWCGGDVKYLTDEQCAKIFPSSMNREWFCDIPLLEATPPGFYHETSYDHLNVDNSTLATVLSNDAINLCLVISKKVQVDGESQIYNKYMCNGDRSVLEPYQTWSSSKIFAMVNAAGRLRSNESSCDIVKIGLDSTVTGKHGVTKFGDLATVVCSYDHTAEYTSNSLASYFHDNGWRDRLYNLVTGSWLGAPTQSLGGNYGEATPSDLSFVATAANSADQCNVDRDPRPTVHPNEISALTAVELTRRLAMHREIKESLRFPGTTWTDVKEILYGAEDSALFPGQKWGGMSADIGIYLQSALDLPSLLQQVDTKGQWRIFSKLGDGYADDDYTADIVTNSYACIPSYDRSGNLVDTLQVTLSARASIANDAGLHKADEELELAIKEAVQYVLQNEVKLTL